MSKWRTLLNSLLLYAYKLTGKQKYLDGAKRCGDLMSEELAKVDPSRDRQGTIEPTVGRQCMGSAHD